MTEEKRFVFGDNAKIYSLAFTPGTKSIVLATREPIAPEAPLMQALTRTAGVARAEGIETHHISVGPGYSAEIAAKNLIDQMTLNELISPDEALEAYKAFGFEPERSIPEARAATAAR